MIRFKFGILIIFYCAILISCQSEISKEQKMLNDDCLNISGHPDMEQLFKCGDYKIVQFRRQTFYDGEIDEAIETEQDFLGITLVKDDYLFGVIIANTLSLPFSNVTKTYRDRLPGLDIAQSPYSGDIVFFKKSINDVNSSSCENNGLYKMFFNFNAKKAGALTKAKLDFNICHDGKTYKIKHDSYPEKKN